MQAKQSLEHAPVLERLLEAIASFPLLFLCALVLVCSCLLTGIVHVAALGKQRPEVHFLVFVVLLTFGTIMVPQHHRNHELVCDTALRCRAHVDLGVHVRVFAASVITIQTDCRGTTR